MHALNLILIRGLPGPAKRAMAARFYPEYKMIDIDTFFTDDKGVYKFDSKQIHTAHRWCRDRTKNLLDEGIMTVVGNTFNQTWEVKPYYDMVKSRGMGLILIEAQGEYENVYNVPQKALDMMFNKQEKTTNILENLYNSSRTLRSQTN